MDSEISNRVTVDLVYVESVNARLERTNKRLWIENLVKDCIIFALVCLFLWILYGVDYESYEVSADGESVAAYVGDDMKGDINYGGTNKSEENNAQERSTGQN